MSPRKISDQQREWLRGELLDWQSSGILSPDQLDRILGRYETVAEGSQRKRGLAAFVLMATAAFLVAVAVLLLIGYNWDALPRSVKLGIIFGVIMLTHAAGFWLRYSKDSPHGSEVVFFLGNLFYGAGIWLIAQVFHLDSHYPDGFWWWALGVLPFALCLDTVLLHFLLVTLLALWVGVEILNFRHLGGWMFGRWHLLPNGAYSLPLLALPGLIWAYRKGSAITVALYAPLLAWWVILQPVAWRAEPNVVSYIGGVGSLFFILAAAHRPGSAFAIPYRAYGVLMTVGVLIPVSYHGFNKEYGNASEAVLAGLLPGAVLLVLLLATVGIVALFNLRRGGVQQNWRDALLDLLARQWLPVSLGVFMSLLAAWNLAMYDSWAAALVPTVVANVALVIMAIWLMRLGIREERARPFASGVACFLLWTVLRYFDLFGGAGGMLGAALMFFLCGGALFGLAMFWRGRKEARHA